MNAVPKATSYVRGRVEICGGYTISIKVPTGAKKQSYSEAGKLVPYLQFAHSAKGGLVNYFLHGDEEALDAAIGKPLTVIATIYEKTLVNGRIYTYVDLELAPEDMVVSRRLVISNMSPDVAAPGESFRVAHANSYISFIPPDAKVNVVGTAKVGPTQSSDAQLSRLVLDGWVIAGEDNTTVTLTRPGSRGITRTMTHHKPKAGLKRKQ